MGSSIDECIKNAYDDKLKVFLNYLLLILDI